MPFFGRGGGWVLSIFISIFGFGVLGLPSAALPSSRRSEHIELNPWSAPWAEWWGGGFNWISARDTLYFLGYGIPYIYMQEILFSS